MSNEHTEPNGKWVVSAARSGGPNCQAWQLQSKARRALRTVRYRGPSALHDRGLRAVAHSAMMLAKG